MRCGPAKWEDTLVPFVDFIRLFLFLYDLTVLVNSLPKEFDSRKVIA